MTYNSPSEETDAFGIFVENFHLIKEHNADYKSGINTFKLEVNKLADKDEDYMAGLVSDLIYEDEEISERSTLPEVPKTNLTYLNYTEEGCVSPMKNQVLTLT